MTATPPPAAPGPRVAGAVIAAAVLAPLGALLCSLINFVLALRSVDLLPLRALFGTPVAWPFPIRPLMLAASLVALLVLAAVCALVVLAVARAARPRRGFAAVLFGTWFAVIIGGWLAGLASSPMVMIAFRYPEQLVPQQILQRVGVGGGWGLYWGWLTGLVCAVIFTAANRAGRGVGTPPVPNP